MKKFGLFTVGIIAGIILLANLGPMIGLAICSIIFYFIFKEFLKSESTGAKILWVVLGLVVLSALLSNIPAIIGVVALYVLYVVYKKWNEEKKVTKQEINDPFTSFEKEWAAFKKNY